MMLFVNGTCSFWSEDLFYEGGRKPDHDERSVFFKGFLELSCYSFIFFKRVLVFLNSFIDLQHAFGWSPE